MTREDDDLYSRCQMLAALVNVLVHDLRNPLHSATLLVEAMGSPSADVEALRNRLRTQLGKLDGLIAETMHGKKELALEPQMEAIAVDVFLRGLAEHHAARTDGAATFVLPPSSGLEVEADRRLVERAALEVASVIAEQHALVEGGPAPQVVLSLDEPEPGTVRLRLGDLPAAYGEALAKAPFAIAGGGIRLAVARSIAQSAGAMLRLEPPTDGVTRFALSLRKTT